MKVLTTFTILADIARGVAKSSAHVESLVRPGHNIHNYQMTLKDFRRLSEAELILYNGLGLDQWLDKFIGPHMKNIPRVKVSNGVNLIEMYEIDDFSNRTYGNPECTTIMSSGACALNMTESCKECKNKIKFANKLVSLPNPHAWMSPVECLVYVDNIRDALIQHDPENANSYKKNAREYKLQLLKLIRLLKNRISALPHKKRWLATSEAGLSYFARDFDFKELYLWRVNSDRQGTPQQVRKMIEHIRLHNIKVVFSESNNSSEPAQVVANNSGARYGGILYVDTLSEPQGPASTYLDLIRFTAATILLELSK